MAGEVNTGMDKQDMKRLLMKSKSEPVSCAFGQGEDKTVALLVMDKVKQPKAVEKELMKQFDGAKNTRWGTAFVDTEINPKLVRFSVNKPISGVARKLVKTLKGTGFSKVEIVLEDGTPLEADSEDELPLPNGAAPDGGAATPGPTAAHTGASRTDPGTDAITPAAGTPAAGTPTAGTPTAGTPTAGTPTAGTPTAGTPTAGTTATAATGNPANPVAARFAEDAAKVKTLTDRGSPGAKQVADLLAVADAEVKAGKFPEAAKQLDTVEAAIVADVNAHIDLAQARVNSLSDWGAAEAGGLDTRVKSLRAKSSLASFTDTFRDYDTLMHDIAGAAAVPVEEQKKRAFVELRKGIVAAIAKVTVDADRAALQKRLDAWDKAAAATDKEKDAGKKKAAQDTLDDVATKLLNDAYIRGGMSNKEEQKVYGKALEARYGFTVSVPNDSSYQYTHLDKMYDVLKMVPPEDVKQASLKKLAYDPPTPYDPDKEGAAYTGQGVAEIDMGNYGGGGGDWPYQNPDGTDAKANGYSISALHELGHSIDDRNGIMKSNQAKGGCGGWKLESAATVTDVLYTDFKAGPGKSLPIPEMIVRALITGTLQGTKPAKPATTTDAVWAPMKALFDRADAMRADKSPWNSPIVVGGRAYHNSYKEYDEWWSYDPGARGGNTVRNYQWRAPGEWFAELYAFTNYKKQKPPSGVDAGVAVFMWKG